LGGNVNEWEESSFDLANISGSSSRGNIGGGWYEASSELSSSARYDTNPDGEFPGLGFRVASLAPSSPVPEPTSMAIFGLGALAMAYRARRKSKA
ncbi:MAG: hypothetical protein RL069_1326, partial [Planctomycetota bacterium]